MSNNNKELFGCDVSTGRRYSINELNQMADNGDIHAQCAMGDYYSILSHCYLKEDDYASAVYWLEKAAELGYPDTGPMLEAMRLLQRRSGQPKYVEDSTCIKQGHQPEPDEDTFVVDNGHSEKIICMLQTMHRDYPQAFLCSRTFKALASDLLRNDYECRGIIRWLSVSLFELNALALLIESRAGNDIFTKHNLIDRLISEGATREMARDAITYINFVAEFGEDK